MNALVLPAAILLGAGALTILVAYLFRRTHSIEATTRRLRIGAALTVAGSIIVLFLVFGDAITTMPQLRQ